MFFLNFIMQLSLWLPSIVIIQVVGIAVDDNHKNIQILHEIEVSTNTDTDNSKSSSEDARSSNKQHDNMDMDSRREYGTTSIIVGSSPVRNSKDDDTSYYYYYQNNYNDNNNDIILKPNNETMEQCSAAPEKQVLVIFIPGAEVLPYQYIELSKQLIQTFAGYNHQGTTTSTTTTTSNYKNGNNNTAIYNSSNNSNIYNDNDNKSRRNENHYADAKDSHSNIQSDNYNEKSSHIRTTMCMFMGIPKFPFNIAQSFDLQAAIHRISKKIKEDITFVNDNSNSKNNNSFFHYNPKYTLYIGHSQGGEVLVEYINGIHTTNTIKDISSSPSKTSKPTVPSSSLLPNGIVLLGSFIGRKYYNNNIHTKIPSLTISGSLDGLCRVTRIMEAFVKQQQPTPPSLLSSTVSFHHPVYVIQGMNHFSSIATGDPSLLIQLRDLKPEVSLDEAVQQIGKLVYSFFTVNCLSPTSNTTQSTTTITNENQNNHKHLRMNYDDETVRMRALQQQKEREEYASAVRRARDTSEKILLEEYYKTKEFLKPIILAYQYEGYYFFQPPCYSTAGSASHNTPASDASSCIIGSDWVNYAYETMAGIHENNNHNILTNATILSTNEFHHMYDIVPVHLPKILSPPCTSSTSSSSTTNHCMINISAISENKYELLTGTDTGFISTSAYEIQVKMVSRQKILNYANYYNPNYTKTDVDTNICAQINNESYTWGLHQIRSSAKENGSDRVTYNRYMKYGEHLFMGNDLGPYNTGPTWIYKHLDWKKIIAHGKNAYVISSPSLRTPMDYKLIKAIAGFHYCKLLSPARVIEWIYIDSLRGEYSCYNNCISRSDNGTIKNTTSNQQ